MIGKRLQLARRAAGLSLRDLEARIDKLVSAQALSNNDASVQRAQTVSL